jgi:hypothetical protein
MKYLKLFESEMNSIFRKKVVYSVECGDLSDLIRKLYGQDPEIEASLELGHDDIFEIEANSNEYDDVEFQNWTRRRSYSRSEIYMLMNKLAKDGHIIDGQYLIQVL